LMKSHNLILQKMKESNNQFTPNVTAELRYQSWLETDAWIWKEDYIYGCIRKKQHMELQNTTAQMIQEYLVLKEKLIERSNAQEQTLEKKPNCLDAVEWGRDLWIGEILSCPPQMTDSLSVVICHSSNRSISLNEKNAVMINGEPMSDFGILQRHAIPANLFIILPFCYSRLEMDGQPFVDSTANLDVTVNDLKRFSQLVQFINQNAKEFLLSISATSNEQDGKESVGKLVLLPYRYVLEWGLYEHLGPASLTRPMDQVLVSLFINPSN
jgi:hypothetical protein